MASIRWAWSSDSAKTPRNLPEHGSEPHQQMCVAAPGGFGELVPVPLDLLARRVLDLDGGPAFDAVTRFTMRAQRMETQTAREALVAEGEPEGCHLVIEVGGPDVRVLAQTLAQIRHERLKRVGFRSPAHAGNSCPVQMVPDRLAITTQVVGDGRDGPSLFPKCCCFHVFFSCEHGDGLLLGLGLGHHKPQEGATFGGGPSGHHGPTGGEFQ
jgi:hypothetical protein